ncbi:hypothetical protein BDW02DRAFT_54997 [Decorospora gaudefroyi]|uniref:Uncharacterized protein n=1 Tax=Decorospora gaudefroyi TaxID=184978 RepID=A0A6A5K556_9PLEO|nr:hypothetical protein BDW02DRAFT_54997 [Decorospora gaudefroyi]
MANTNLIIALVFAAVFGAALIWLTLWYIHRWIHQRCFDLEHWFHILIPRRSRQPQRVYVERVEQGEDSKHRSRSAKRERGYSEHARSRKRHESHDREANTGWPRQRDVERARPAMNAPVQQQQPYGQPYYPSIGWQNPTQGAGQMAYPQQALQSQVPMPWPAQGAAGMSPFVMPMVAPQQPLPQMTAQIPEPVQYPPQYQARPQPQYQKPYAETMTSDAPKASQRDSSSFKARPPAKRMRPVEQVNYIHICDEYPPFVQEALKKAAPPSPSSSSSSSSDSSGTTQEVPRASIPRAKPGFADTLPFQFPQYPQMATRAWNAPRSYPRQWTGDGMGGGGPDVKARL